MTTLPIITQKKEKIDRHFLDHQAFRNAQTMIDQCPERLKDNLSDGYHTFASLYWQRMMLTAALAKAHPDKCWKTKRHEDGELCFGGGWFLVSFETEEGLYGYHYENKYWDYFDVPVLEKAKHWDGYTDDDVNRLLSL